MNDTSCLADAFAEQCRRWSAAAPAAARNAAADAARALVHASFEGHVCLPPGTWPRGVTAAHLLASGVAGPPGQGFPLVVTADEWLYLARFDDLEQRLARAIARLRDENRLHIVTGGPGSGKTTRVAELLAERLAARPALRIALAATTGKAAARLSDSLRAAGRKATTVHSLLGLFPGARRPRYGPHNPLPADLLIVDEASMLDLALATRLVEALDEAAELILLGDRDQLAAIESGAVLAELTSDTPDNPVRDAVTRLRGSYRFAADSNLGRLATGLRDNCPQVIAAAIAAGDEVRVVTEPSLNKLYATLRAGYQSFRVAVDHGPEDPAAVFAALDAFRIICAEREGPRGVVAINRACESASGGSALSPLPYAGRPILVTRNDPSTRLANGDVGVLLPDDGGLSACFRDGPAFRRIPLARLPAHESAYAMTVHKSQGSEFDHVAFVLPQPDSPMLGRELVYTAVTRARQGITLLGEPESLFVAAAKTAERYSGLLRRLGANPQLPRESP